MKEFTFKIVISEGSDEFWESLENSSINEQFEVISEEIKNALEFNGFDGQVEVYPVEMKLNVSSN